MTIRDLLAQGVQIQGAYQIKCYDDKKETYDILCEGSMFEYEFRCGEYEEDDSLDLEIVYLYSIPTGDGSGAYTVFEVEKED